MNKIKGYKFTASADANTPAKLYIYGVIGWDVMSKDVSRDIDALGGVPLEIRINSCGGDCIEANAIYNAIKNYSGEKTAYIDSMSGSAASYIMLACPKIVAYANSTIFIHNVQGGGIGDADDMEHAAEMLRKFQSSYIAAYIEKTGKTEDEVRSAMDAETLFTAAEAKDFGLIDEIASDTDESARDRAKNYFKMVAQFNYCQPKPQAKSRTTTKGNAMQIKDKKDLTAALESLKELEQDALKTTVDEIIKALEPLEVKVPEPNKDGADGDDKPAKKDGEPEKLTQEKVSALIDAAVAKAKAETKNEYEAKFNKLLAQGYQNQDAPKNQLGGRAAAAQAWQKKFAKKD